LVPVRIGERAGANLVEEGQGIVPANVEKREAALLALSR
jgi:hypothetical protein